MGVLGGCQVEALAAFVHLDPTLTLLVATVLYER